MWKLNLKGYDSLIIGNKVQMPDIFTLSMLPIYVNTDFAETYEKCNSPMLRELMDRVPLKGGYKHTMITSIVNFISPRTSTIQNAQWHIDPGVPAPHKHDARLHVLASGYDLTSTTKFIKHDTEVELPDEYFDARHKVLRTYLTDHSDDFGFEAVGVPPDCFVTFTNLHPHIALPSEKFELRYFLRVQESDIEPPREYHVTNNTKVLIDMSMDAEMIVSLEQKSDGIFLRTKF